MTNSRRKISDEEIIELLKSGSRPVWTTKTLSDELDITRQTANNRLKTLAEQSEDVSTIEVGQARAYYVPGISPDPPGDTIEERHRQSIIQAFTDRFVGLLTAPWTAVHPNDGPATGGDRVQIQVEGVPGRWSSFLTRTWENRRESLEPGEVANRETQALVSGELYERPTTPIQHQNIPPDYDLELNLGVKEVETDKGTAFIAAGVKNYLIRPRNDAVFLKDVSVDWISPKGEGQVLETFEITEEMIDDVEEWQEEHVEDDPDPI